MLVIYIYIVFIRKTLVYKNTHAAMFMMNKNRKEGTSRRLSRHGIKEAIYRSPDNMSKSHTDDLITAVM